MTNIRKICVFSGTRAEYGLLSSLIKRIHQDTSLDLSLLVSGTHLSPEFGYTYQEIEADGFHIDEKIEILVSSDSPSGVCKSMGLGLIQFTDAIERLDPDIIILLGDRYETFCLAAAALVNNIPVAHIHGGESSYGAIDESFRHAITKMSHLHFTSSQIYRDRVIQLGEHPDKVFNVGALGVENIKSIPFLSEKDLNTLTGFDTPRPFFLITFHPETVKKSSVKIDFQDILNALTNKNFLEYNLIFTKANADSHGRKINQMIDAFVEKNCDRAVVFSSMGQKNYLSAMRYAKLVIGNSSSGILEAPSFKVPVVNIGQRQDGRLRADNVIDCSCDETQIISAMNTGLSDPFVLKIQTMKNPFEKNNTAMQILTVIKNIELNKLCSKQFYDLSSHGSGV